MVDLIYTRFRLESVTSHFDMWIYNYTRLSYWYGWGIGVDIFILGHS